MKNVSEKFVLTDKGDINKFLCIGITQIGEKIFKVSKPLLIDRIISLLNIDINYYGM